MKRFLSLPRLMALFGVALALTIGAVMVFQWFWVDPGDRCEAQGNWYDIEGRVCAQPIYIPNITGRAPGESRANASDRGNRELIELEAEVAAEKRARNAAIESERAQAAAR